MSDNDKKGVVNGIVLSSVAVAIAYDVKKEKNSLLMIAYSKSEMKNDISFVAIGLSKKKTYTREDFLAAIRIAEGVKTITYVDFDGTDKDIYICRAAEGEVYDFVQRDDIQNRYVCGFAEVEASNLKFSAEVDKIKTGVRLEIPVAFNNDGVEYEQNGLNYAVVNAYNACLLGKILSKDEFQLETGDRTRVKYEIRAHSAKYVDLSTLYIHPEKNEGDNFVSSYLTEPLNVIDGDEMSSKIYRIIYRASFNGYHITRCN